MSGDAQLQLQKAIYNALTTALATAGTGGVAVPVLDHVLQNQAFPYVEIGDGDTGEFDTDTEVGQEHRVQVHVYDRHRGKKEVKRLQGLIRDALDNVALSLETGAALVYIYFEFSAVFREPDGLTYHGVTRFRAVTTEA